MASPTLEKFAPAKINLFLHVTGKRDDGYHILDSLIGFADFGDTITIAPSYTFLLNISGDNFSPDIKDNSITKAVHLLSDKLKIKLPLSITLEKNIPIGGGLGGGSADAAAAVHGILEYAQESLSQEDIDAILLELGADTPICYARKPAYIKGIGEIIEPVSSLPRIPAILVYPNEFCSTAEIFQSFDGTFSQTAEHPKSFSDQKSFYNFLQGQRNDLTEAAVKKIPEIGNILETINAQDGCIISRLTGSGSTCFGLFETPEQSANAAEKIQKEKPHWWVRPVIIS